ncbi:hypothetical protein [Herminiimonas arsenitoxidans]|uniref:hypothetical protein n=1 Tax=Herminiimonas arsenitoxidans TaxID=1809410 RepID=UPI0009709936|nr:hypothetical protein [Herminiimonas arsenitoxidans]
MMYQYSAINRLDYPHTYMYTTFEGTPFLRSYIESRLQAINSLDKKDNETNIDDAFLNAAFVQMNENFLAPFFNKQKEFCLLVGPDFSELSAGNFRNTINSMVQQYDEFSLECRVVTLELLESMISLQLQDPSSATIKIWLDRLIQRFEVTKKLFMYYLPGFRKGDGANDDIRLYWLLALSLSLFYSKSHEIKYLNTLLKICDLLCSLLLQRGVLELPQRGLRLVLAAEIVSIQSLLARKGVALDSD